MRIGIDYRPALDVRGGIGVYVHELVEALRLHAPRDALALFGHRLRRPAGAVADVPAGATLHRRRVPAPLLAVAGRVGLGADRLMGGVDVLHATDYVPLASSRAPLVATIHDVCFLTLPDCYPEALGERLATATDRLVEAAARIIVPSARVRDELLLHTLAEAERVRVVPHGPPRLPTPVAAARPPVEGRYLLCVATVQPRKNLARLLDAFAGVREAHDDVSLVVAGPPGWGSEALQEELRTTERVCWLPAVDRRGLAALYRDAAAVAYPSLGEGFGFPVLEAWQAGVPILVGAHTAAADLGGDAALAVDPYDPAAIARGLLALLEDDDRRGACVAAGTRALDAYSWARTAADTHAVYREALEA